MYLTMYVPYVEYVRHDRLEDTVCTYRTVPSLANAKWVNRVTTRVMSSGTIVNRTSRRIDRFRAGPPLMGD